MNDTYTISNFIKLLNSLVTITKNQGEHFKSVAYTKAINELHKYLKNTQISTEVLSYNDLKKLKLPNIGKTILEKYEEFLKTGTLEVVEREKTNPVNIFANIYGIGPIKAKELVTKKNIVTLEQLRAQQNNIQENKTTNKYIKNENIGDQAFAQTYELWAAPMFQYKSIRLLPPNLENKFISFNVAAAYVLMSYIHKLDLKNKLLNS
jgi:hypothetical protein